MTKEKFFRLLFLIGAAVLILVVAIGVYEVQKNSLKRYKNKQLLENSTQLSVVGDNAGSSQVPSVVDQKSTVNPIENALARITKKPFGIYITPKDSPVQPERFQGYHTGVDLEIYSEEVDVDVPVKALCDGKLLSARFASGYGGVVVQNCILDGQDVTAVYGHISLASMKAVVNSQLKAGDFLANLGGAYSRETDGERKHLHLGIHKGNAINILGYVQNKGDLDEWLDPAAFLHSD